MDRMITIDDLAELRRMQQAGDSLDAALMIAGKLRINTSKIDMRHLDQVVEYAIMKYAEEEIDPLDEQYMDSLIDSGCPSPKSGRWTSEKSEPSSETPPSPARRQESEQLVPVG